VDCFFFASSYTGFKMVHFSAYLACASEVMLTSGDGGFGRNSCSDSETSFHRTYTLLLPVSICPRTGDRRLPMPVLHPGTRCLTISRTLIFPFELSNLILRPSFPYTSTFSTFEVSDKNALYKFTIIIIFLRAH